MPRSYWKALVLGCGYVSHSWLPWPGHVHMGGCESHLASCTLDGVKNGKHGFRSPTPGFALKADDRDHQQMRGGRDGNEASWITLCPPRSDDDPSCNLNHFHPASQGSKELVNITSWPCVSFSQLHFQLRAEEKREPSVRCVKKQEEGWEVGWCMKNIIGEKRTEVVNSWRRRYFGVSIADNGCRSGKIPTPGEKGLSELLSVPHTQDLCLPWPPEAHTLWL